MISLEAARAILDATGAPIDRVETITAQRSERARARERRRSRDGDVPPFSRAGMDGYAVRARDTQGASRAHPRTLTKVATLYTGEVSAAAVRDGQCVEISTGAPMPDGADAVIMVEETDSGAGDDVRDIRRSAAAAECRRARRGHSIGTGRRRRGRDAQLEPHRRARRHRHSSGRRVSSGRASRFSRPAMKSSSPDRNCSPGQIYDINRFTLSAVVADNGGIPVAHPPAPDTLDALVETLDALVDYDIVVFSGGSSVGERDLIRDAIAAKGRLLFHGVAVKPGKPTGLGVVNGKPVFAMPGYPDLVPVERAHAARADAAPHRAAGPKISKTLTHAARAGASRRQRDGISSIRCESRMARPCRHSRPRATSPACRVRTDISRFPPTSTPLKREPRLM